MESQLVSFQPSFVGLHLKSSPTRTRKLITHKPTALCLATQNSYLDFSVGSAGRKTRILRRAAASGTNGTMAETEPQGIYANIDFRTRALMDIISLLQLYYLPVAVLQRLKDAPERSLKTLDSMKLLMTLCRSAAPAVAQEVEKSMRAEYLKLKEKAASKASGVSTDTPFNVLASDFDFTEGVRGESGRQAPIRNAIKLASSPYWDNWKYQLRSGLISSPIPSPKTAYAVSFSIETRTADDIEMIAWLDVLAGGSLSLGSIATNGPSQDADPVLKSFLLLEYLQYPESSMLDALSAMCWKVAVIPSPEKFSLTFFNHASPSQKEYNKIATDGRDDDGINENEFVIQGSGEELKVLLMALAGLESGELLLGTCGGQIETKKALTPWIPANERLQVRRLQDGSSYEMRAALIDRESSDSEDSVVLSSRQVRAVIDCLDAFCELHPSFGLNVPNLDWPKAQLLQQLAATLRL
ncbi:hypothetical protein NADE_003057 [Nannochloris sp. 'desiccata']|nr:hypothetical protein NADE_003057 [Chlorella desiccata (nom. nud.)]